MKDYVQNKYSGMGQEKQRSQDEICRIVTETWDEAKDGDEVENLMESVLLLQFN